MMWNSEPPYVFEWAKGQEDVTEDEAQKVVIQRLTGRA
jgi:hypothetical protein